MTKKKGQVWELSDMPFSYILVLNKYIYIYSKSFGMISIFKEF